MQLLALTMATKATALVKPLTSNAAVIAQVPKLVDLAAECGWDFYGPNEWTFLADAACDSGWVVEGVVSINYISTFYSSSSKARKTSDPHNNYAR